MIYMKILLSDLQNIAMPFLKIVFTITGQIFFFLLLLSLRYIQDIRI